MFSGVEALSSAGAFIQGRELDVVALMRPIFWDFSWPVGLEIFAGFGVVGKGRGGGLNARVTTQSALIPLFPQA